MHQLVGSRQSMVAELATAACSGSVHTEIASSAPSDSSSDRWPISSANLRRLLRAACLEAVTLANIRLICFGAS